jgi:hypothetical protein
MASKTADKKHSEALQRFQIALEADKTNRENALEDAQFVAGEQWPLDIKLQRQSRPCLTINRLPTFIRQVSNEVRIKPPSISVIPSEEGDDDTAQVIEGLIRSIEARSKAKRIYSRGIEDSARCGMGFWRVLTEYANDEAFDLDLCIESIANPLGVIVDPDAPQAPPAAAQALNAGAESVKLSLRAPQSATASQRRPVATCKRASR